MRWSSRISLDTTKKETMWLMNTTILLVHGGMVQKHGFGDWPSGEAIYEMDKLILLWLY